MRPRPVLGPVFLQMDCKPEKSGTVQPSDRRMGRKPFGVV